MPTDTELIAEVQEVTEQETAETETSTADEPPKKKKRRARTKSERGVCAITRCDCASYLQ